MTLLLFCSMYNLSNEFLGKRPDFFPTDTLYSFLHSWQMMAERSWPVRSKSRSYILLPINAYQTYDRKNKLLTDFTYTLSAYSHMFNVGPNSVLLGILS